MTHTVHTSCTAALAVFSGNICSVLVRETLICIREPEENTLSDVATKVILYVDLRDQTSDTAVENQCPTI